MSRAFVKETDDVQEILPDRPISPHPNLVTPRGLALIERDLSAAATEHKAAQASQDRAAIARMARDFRYWTSHRGSAQVVVLPRTADAVRFGSIVTISRDDGRVQTFQIVGRMRPIRHAIYSPMFHRWHER